MLMLILFAALNEVFQFLEVFRPAHSVEKLRAGELGFVKRVFQIARPQVQIAKAALGEISNRGGHHEHAQVPAVVIQIVKCVIIIGELVWLDV